MLLMYLNLSILLLNSYVLLTNGIHATRIFMALKVMNDLVVRISITKD